MIIKKVIACTLALCMMLGLGNYYPGPSFALSESIYTTYKASVESKYTETERQAFKVRIDDLSEYKGRNESQNNTLYTSDITIEQILYYLLEYKGLAQDPSGYDTRKINPYVYKKYKVIAYEELSVIEKDRAGHGSYERVDTAEGKELEYRYLGYTDIGIKISNDFYPADFKSGTDPRSRTYNTTSKATESWMSFIDKPHYGQLYQLMNTNLKNDDTTDGTYRPVGYTTFDLLGLNSFPGISGYLGNSNLRSAFGKVIKMQEPSLGVSGQFKLVHGTNKSYYDTFRTEEMTLHADVTIYPSESVYFIAENQDQVTIEYEVRTIIDNDKTNLPYSNGLNISAVTINSEGNEAEVFSNPSYSDKNLERVLSSTFTKTVKVNHLDLSDGQDTVAIDASSSYKDMTGYAVNFSASPVQVKINAESDFVADFTIHDANGEDVTGGVVTLADLNFNDSYTYTFKDASSSNKGEINSRIWKVVLNDGSKLVISKTNEEEVNFTITAENKSSVLINDKLHVELDARNELSDKAERANKNTGVKKPEPPQPVPSGPEAIIAAKLDTNSSGDYIAIEGEVFDIHGRDSYHPEGVKLESYVFNTNGGNTSSTGSKKNDYIYYLESGKYYPELTVTDANGGTDSDSTTIRVRPAEFIPVITIEGTLKENRKVSISVENEHSLRYYPIDEPSLNWTITPLDDRGNAVEIDGGADGHQSFDLLFNKKGEYQVSVTGDIYNGIKRRSGTATQIITIAEDLPPVVDFSVSTKLVRDVNNDNLTEIIVFDKSFSPDGDIISQRKVWWRYDDDNDNDFGDIDWILASAGNAITTSMFTKDVGQYEIKEEIKEQFGQTTIAKFIVDADYKRSNSDSKADDEKRVEIINIAPTVTLDVANKKAVNLVVYHDYDAAALNDFENRADILKAELLGKQMDLSIKYLTPTEVVGEREVWTSYFDTYISVDVYVEGEGEKDSPWSSGSEWNINEVKTLNFYLDGFSTEGNESELQNTNKSRFEIKNVSWGGNDYKKYNYKGRSKDYTEFAFKVLNVTYYDNGVEKTAAYKFVYDWRDYEKDSDGDKWDHEITYTKTEIVGHKLNVDVPYQSRPKYVELNHQFQYNDGYEQFITMPTNVKREVQLKKYNQELFGSIVSSCKGKDTFFLNLCSEESNRLALNQTLLEALKENNINYLTIEDGSIGINPLSGRFDSLTLGKFVGINWNNGPDRYDNTVRRLYVTIGKLLYELDQENHRYNLKGLATDANIDKYRDSSSDMVEIPSETGIYTVGYDYQGDYSSQKYYGVNAINYKMKDDNSDEIEVWSEYNNYIDSGNGGGKNVFVNEWFSESFYNNHCSQLNVMPDGQLVGKKLYMGYYPDGEFTKKAVSYGSGYVGVLRNFSIPSTYDTPQIKGFIHSNGNIYFKMGNGQYNYGFINKVVVTEGIDNIKILKYSKALNLFFVYTDDMVVKYNVENGNRTVITDNFIERKGISVKIADDTWMIGENVYTGYKEIYTTDLEGDEFIYHYTYHGRRRSSNMNYWLRLYIDTDNNLYEEKYDSRRSGNGISKTLIAENVKSLPLMGGVSDLPTPENGEDTKTKYNYYMSYLDENNYLHNRNGDDLFNSPLQNIDVIGSARGYDWVGSHETYYNSLISLIDGTLGTNSSRTPNLIGKIKYANLTVGSSGDVVGDNQLISSTSLSQKFSNLDKLMDGIYAAYENYSSSNSIYVLLGDSIEATMTYDDYESDEAYSQVYDFVHTDPSYFENSLGKDPNAGKGLLKPLTRLNYVGHYTVSPKVRDNPKDDDRFDNYRLTNKDEATVNVYVHRKPVARMKYKIGESTTVGYFTLTCSDGGSYDLDHMSEVNNGITAWKFGIKSQDEGSWTIVNSDKFTHNKIVPGLEYKTFYMVKDMEGVWSEPVYEDLIIEDIPIHLEAKLKSDDEKFNIAAMPITEFFSIYDIETEYTSELKLEIGLYDGDVRKGNLVSIPFSEGVSAVTDSTNSSLITWNERTLQVPSTLANKNYKLRVTAIDIARPSKRKVVEFDIEVRTPINPVPDIPQVFTADETIELICKTSKYTDELSVTLFDNTVSAEEHSMIYSEMDGDKKVWKLTYKIPGGIDDGSYDAKFTGRVNTIPAKTQSVTKHYEYITLKILSAAMFPEDPMAGDKLIWVIESVGGVDRYEMIFEDDVINNDQRKEMGYDEVEYPYYVEVDGTQSRKTDQLEYILWCTTPQSITLKDVRNRPEYSFKIRAWKGSSYVDADFTKEISGDVRELLKVGH